jgi:hypothetical protein
VWRPATRPGRHTTKPARHLPEEQRMTAHRETHLRLFGEPLTVRTEQTGTVDRLERDHLTAVKAAVRAAYQAEADRRIADGLSERNVKHLRTYRPQEAQIPCENRRWQSQKDLLRPAPKVRFSEDLPDHLLPYLGNGQPA